MNKEKMILKYYKYKYEDYGWNPVFCMVMRIKHLYMKKHKSIAPFEEMLVSIDKECYIKLFSCIKITQHENLVGFKYNLQTTPKDMWDNPNSFYRECRSIVIDIENESIVICPFRKFFNLDEIEENNVHNLRFEILTSNTFEVTDKLDGSMQCATWYNDRIVYVGSKAINMENSWRVKDGFSMLNENHKKMIKEYKGFTLIFEYISKKDVHVVNYNKDQEGLYLIGMRQNKTGEELTYNELKMLARVYNVNVVNMENLTFNELLEQMKTAKCNEKEGWVLNIDGHKVKIKTDDYVNMHRLFGVRPSPNIVIEAIADGYYDDFYAKVPESQKEYVSDIEFKIKTFILQMEHDIFVAYKSIPKDLDKRETMIYIQENVDKDIRGYVINKYLGKDYNVLKSKNGKYRKAKEIGIEEEI